MPLTSPDGYLDFTNAVPRAVKMVATSNVGIGTSSPIYALDVHGTSNTGPLTVSSLTLANGAIEGDLNISGNLVYTSNTTTVVNSNVVVEYTGPHGRDPKEVPLKKYPEIVFEEGKFDANESTNTYVQAGYTVSASSDQSQYDLHAWKIFDGVKSIGNGWASQDGTYYDGSSPANSYNGATHQLGTGTAYGEWLKLELPNKIKVSKFTLYADKGVSYGTDEAPKSYKIYGSVTGSSWTEIKDVSNETPSTNGNSHDITDTTAYKYLAIVVTQVNTDQDNIRIGELEYYGYEEDPPAGDSSLDATFKSVLNTPQTTGVQVYVDAKLSSDFTNQMTDPTPVGTATTHNNTGKYWELTGALTSNVTLEANTFLEGDQPHAVSVWFNSSNLEANVSNTCVFSISDQEKLDSVNLDLQSNTWHNLTYSYQGEGGSRVTYLDGRKVAEDQAEDTFGEYPPFAMTGYSQGGYVVSASSEASASWQAWEAFDKQDIDTSAWLSSAGGYPNTSGNATSGRNLGTSSGGSATADGDWLKIELPHKIRLNYITMTGYNNVGVDDFDVVATNDDTNWEVLLSDTLPSAAYNVPYSFVIPSSVYYKYYAIIVKSHRGTVHPYTGIYELRLYGHRENDLVRLPDPTRVLKYPHIAMTGVSDIDDMAQRGYVITSSGKYPTGSEDQQPSKIFDGDTSTFWKVKHEYTVGGSGGTHSGNNLPAPGPLIVTVPSGSVTKTGEFVILETPHKLKISKVDVVATFAGRRPTKVAILGSNTKTQTGWRLLNDDTLTLPAQDTNTVTIPSPTYYYKYHAYVILQATSGHSGAQTYELRYYGTEEATPVPIQIGGGNIDKVANFRVYDKFVEEDQALEIWDAQKDEFGRAKSSMTLHKGRLGIGTEEPEGRLAVLDEPHNFEEFPPRAMTDYKTYFEGHGEFCASASSSFGTYYPWNAFDKNTTDDSTQQAVWHTAADFTNATPGIYNAGASLGGYTGAWLKLKLPYSIKPSKVSIHPRTYPGGTSDYDQNPKDFLILGSKDDNTWDVLSTQTDVVFGTTWKDFTLSPGNNTYNYFAISCTKVKHGQYFAINDMKYFGTREQGQSVLHDGELTLTKNLNVPRIGPALDEDDTPRRDRLVVEYNTSTNPTFEGAVRDTSGRGFHGALFGGAYYDATEKALRFDGSGDYTEVQLPSHQVKGEWIHSVSCWVKADIINGEEAVWNIGDRAGQASGQIGSASTLAFNNTSPTLRWYLYNADAHTSNFTVATGQWYHITCVYTGGVSSATSQTIYVNGVEYVFNIFAGAGGALNFDANRDRILMLGRLPWGSSSDLDGAISNFKLYDCALTAQEVKTLYNMGRCDEGHHVVNFSKTRVGIGLGDGEAPKGALDVREQGIFRDILFDQRSTDNNNVVSVVRYRRGGEGGNYWKNWVNTSNHYYFNYNGTDSGYFASSGPNSRVQNFTGQHRTFIKDVPFSQAGDLEGLIVSSDQNKYVKMSGGIEAGSNAITTNESLPVVSLSTTTNDKKCFGVISASEDPETREDTHGILTSIFEKEKGDTRVYINSVGEGAIWVVNTNGSLESGDYITTSNVAGYGQKQDSEFLANYTVAKITMDCDFEPATQPVQQILRSNVVETYYLGNVHHTKTVPHEFVTTVVSVDDDWSNVSVSPPDVTYAEWSNLEANTQNTYTLTYTQTSNVVYDTKYTLTTTTNVTESDSWDNVFIDPPGVTYAEWSNLEANTQNTYTLTFTQTTTDEKTPEEWSALEPNTQSLYNKVYYQSVEEEVAADYPGAVAHTRVTDVIENELDEHGQIQWEDHPTETEKAYKIRFLDASGIQTDEANAVHIAAFVGCTYHCG